MSDHSVARGGHGRDGFAGKIEKRVNTRTEYVSTKAISKKKGKPRPHYSGRASGSGTGRTGGGTMSSGALTIGKRSPGRGSHRVHNLEGLERKIRGRAGDSKSVKPAKASFQKENLTRRYARERQGDASEGLGGKSPGRKEK